MKVQIILVADSTGYSLTCHQISARATRLPVSPVAEPLLRARDVRVLVRRSSRQLLRGHTNLAYAVSVYVRTHHLPAGGYRGNYCLSIPDGAPDVRDPGTSLPIDVGAAIRYLPPTTSKPAVGNKRAATQSLLRQTGNGRPTRLVTRLALLTVSPQRAR